MDNSKIYNLFLNYYGDIQLGKIKSQDGYSIYASSFHTGLLKNRYLFVINYTKPLEPNTTTLSQCQWVCIQTRETEDYYKDLPKVNHILNDKNKNLLLHRCRTIEKNKENAIYNCPLPLKITLLKPSKNFVFPDEILLFQVLETYNSSIEFL